MPSTSAQRESVRKATIDFVRAPHPRNDDEDMHPARLDETEEKLDRALAGKPRDAPKH